MRRAGSCSAEPARISPEPYYSAGYALPVYKKSISVVCMDFAAADRDAL